MHARLLCPLLLVVPAIVGAQQTARDTARVAAVVVTATRSPLAAERAPATVTVLTGTRLRAEGITTVGEALRQVPGLSLAQAGSHGGATSLFIRGGESKFTKVLVDGVPVNEGGGAFDFSALTTDNVERIEIVRGPASVLYGSDAMAGVVQLFTRRGVPGTRGDLSVRGGTFGSWDAEGAVRGSRASVDWSAAGARHETRGFQAFNSDFRDEVASALLGYTGDAGDLRLTVRHRDADYHYPTDGSGQVVDSNAVRREGRTSVGIDGGVRVAPIAELRATFASNTVHGVSQDQPDSPGDVGGYYYTSTDRSWRRSADVRLELGRPTSTRLTLGGTVERQWQESGTTSSFGDTPTESHARRTSGAYTQLLLLPTERSTLTLGARFEHNERFGDFTTWRAAGSVAPRAGTRLRASAGTAFREPSFLENYGCCGFVTGNPGLSPERAFSVDAGIEQDVGGVAMLGATVFSNAFRDLIDYTSATSGPNYVNVARTRARGAELEARVTLPLGLHADGSLTWLDARVVDPGAGAGPTALFVRDARLLRRPMHTANAGIGYRGVVGALDLRALHVGAREDNYFAPDFSSAHVTLAPYTRFDVSGELNVVPTAWARGTAAVTLRVENLFDARYTDVAGVNFDFRGDDLRNTGYRGAPRRILIGGKVGIE